MALHFSSESQLTEMHNPQVPKFLELVGLGYTSWFVYRYLLFKVSHHAHLEA